MSGTTVYVTYTAEHYEGCSEPIAVFTTLQAARASFPDRGNVAWAKWSKMEHGTTSRFTDNYRCGTEEVRRLRVQS